jgi:C4-dicarboxylate transporter DctM subunit
MMMGIANIYSYIFARENIGPMISKFLTGISSNPTIIVALIIGLMLILGCFMETVAVTIVIVPVFFPVVRALGVDEVAFGVLFTISAVVGSLTPPVGFYLFLGMKMTDTPFAPAAKRILPVVGITLVVMGLIILFPQIASFLPNLMMQ